MVVSDPAPPRRHVTAAPGEALLPTHLLFLFLLLLLGHLRGLVLPHQLRQVGDVLVRLLQQVGQALVLLLIDELAVPLLIFRLTEREVSLAPRSARRALTLST